MTDAMRRAVPRLAVALVALLPIAGCNDSVGLAIDRVDGPEPQPRPVALTAHSYTLAVGDTVRLRAVDPNGNVISNSQMQWTSMNTLVAAVGDFGLVTGRSNGQTRVVVHYGTAADTATIVVSGGGTTGGGASVTVVPSFASVLVGGTVSLSVTVKDSLGNTVSAPQLGWQSLDAGLASVTPTGVVQGLAPGTARIRVSWSTFADTAIVAVSQPLPGGGTSLTPAILNPLLGPLVARGSSGVGGAITTYDNRYVQTELARFQDYLKVENDPQGAYLLANHYGGLRSRLMWAIRNGEPWGPGVTDETRYGYARGLRIIRRYLKYSESNKFGIPAHNNTGLADVELLYRIEGDPDALMHIHCSAAAGTSDPWGYIDLTHPNNTAPRVPAISLQAINAAHRLGVPYARCPQNSNLFPDPSLSSWLDAGERIVGWMDDYITAKASVYGLGGLPASAHGGQEAYFMNALLAVQLLDWHGYVKPNPRALDLAQLIMSHLIDMLALKPGWSTLGYETNSAGPADDLAGYYIWPSLVLWQETGQQKYFDFAMKNLAATSKAYIDGMKQWNQVYSTLGQGTEALIQGVSWH